MAIDTISVYAREYFDSLQEQIYITFTLFNMTNDTREVMNIGLDALAHSTGIYIDSILSDNMAAYCIDTEDAHFENFAELSEFIISQYSRFFDAVNHEMCHRHITGEAIAFIELVRDDAAYPIHEYGQVVGIFTDLTPVGTDRQLINSFYRNK
jgi:hypothetical protein